MFFFRVLRNLWWGHHSQGTFSLLCIWIYFPSLQEFSYCSSLVAKTAFARCCEVRCFKAISVLSVWACISAHLYSSILQTFSISLVVFASLVCCFVFVFWWWSAGGVLFNLSIDVNHKEGLCGLSSSGKKHVSEWVFTHGWWWNDLKDERWTETDRNMYSQGERRRTETKTRMGHRETWRRPLFLHHYFNSHFSSTFSSSHFIIRSPSHLFFLLFIFSLCVSIISFYLSVSFVFCCSDTQTNEPWNIRHQDPRRGVSLLECVCMCVWVEGFTHACLVCAHFAFGLEVCGVFWPHWNEAHLCSVWEENVKRWGMQEIK